MAGKLVYVVTRDQFPYAVYTSEKKAKKAAAEESAETDRETREHGGTRPPKWEWFKFDLE